MASPSKPPSSDVAWNSLSIHQIHTIFEKNLKFIEMKMNKDANDNILELELRKITKDSRNVCRLLLQICDPVKVQRKSIKDMILIINEQIAELANKSMSITSQVNAASYLSELISSITTFEYELMETQAAEIGADEILRADERSRNEDPQMSIKEFLASEERKKMKEQQDKLSRNTSHQSRKSNKSNRSNRSKRSNKSHRHNPKSSPDRLQVFCLYFVT